MNSASSSPTDLQLASLTLGSPQRVNDPYDYDPHARSPYNYQTSPPVIPGQSPITQMNSPQTPIKPPKPARAGLPTQWLDSTPPPLPDANRSLSPYHTSELSSGGGSSPPPINGFSSTAFQSSNPGTVLADDEVIPNAIVIKNIPFNVKRETLLDIITSLNIPTPYAFNYHLDPAGAFRGLAFANFRNPEDADAVVVALNGFDVQGRKLRVEYKKVLQAGEKERIEREKALRRMRSMQMEREKQQQYDDFSSPGALGAGGMYSPPQSYMPTQPSLYPGSSPSMPSLPSLQNPLMGTPIQAQPATPKAATSPPELDMNDAATLEIYSRILLFKDDPMRDELAFSRTLSPKQRRVVHLISQKLGVYHYSVGEGEERYAVVTRIDPDSRQTRTPQRHTSQTLSRASSSYLQSSANSNNAFNSSTLRSKKSMPDMKTLHTSAPRLTVRASNSNLREGFHTIASSSRRQPGGFGALFGNNGGAFGSGGLSGDGGGIPPVPTLPAGLQSNGMNDGPTHGIMRQPRGPSETGAGFNMRRTSVATLNSISDQSSIAPGLEARSHEPLEI